MGCVTCVTHEQAEELKGDQNDSATCGRNRSKQPVGLHWGMREGVPLLGGYHVAVR
jgi:hypothetical protein